MNITPESTHKHTELEAEVTEYLIDEGFLVAQAPYHTTMDDKMVKALQNLYTPTSMYVRSRADRIAVRERPPLVFEWEAKTHASSYRHDCTIELYPVIAHILKARLDVRCLYIYRDPWKGYDFGFWIRELPEVRAIMIPDRWDDAWTSWYMSYCKRFFPKTPIRTGMRTRGSGDPFLIIDESIIKELPHWKEQIQTAMKSKLFAMNGMGRRNG